MRLVGISILCGACAISQVAQVTAAAATRAVSEAGAPYVSGGVGQIEQDRLASEKGKFSLSIVTAMRGSGHYLAGVRVQIFDSDGRSVFVGHLDGPWLLIDLPADRYVVEAQFEGEKQSQATITRSGGHRELIFYFDERPGQATAPRSDKKGEVRLQRKRLA